MADNKDNNLLSLGSLGTERGASGTWISGGFITHEEYNQQLVWRRGIDVFNKMRKSDASIQALLKVAKHPILAATFSVEEASDEEFDQYVKRFVENELFNRNVNFYNFKRDALGKLDFGFSIFEKTYEHTTFENQDRIGIKNLGWRKQWSILRWETEDGQPGVTQQLMNRSASIPQEKLLVFVNDREGDNYQGVSLLRYVYKLWDIKHRIENLMAMAAERSLGVPVFEEYEHSSKNTETDIDKILRNFRANNQGYIKYPQAMGKLDWMKIETNIRNDLLPMLEYIQHEIDKSILAQFLDLAGSRSGGSGGSRALSQDQSQLFEKALEAIVNEMLDVINRDLIQQLCDLNFSNLPNGYPKLTCSNIGDQNLDVKGKYMNLLAQVDLLTPDPDLENIVRQWADLPDLPDDIYNNYDQRVTAQTKALPLTPLGPGQTPGAPASTGQKLENPSTDQKPLALDQSNRSAIKNDKADNADKPTPVANAYGKPRTRATEDLANYRRELIAAVMADEQNAA